MNPNRCFLPSLQKKKVNLIKIKHIENIKMKENKVLAVHFILDAETKVRKLSTHTSNPDEIKRRRMS